MFYINIDSNKKLRKIIYYSGYIYGTTDIYLNWKYVEILCDSVLEILKVYN